MRIRPVLVVAALACAPALRAQEVELQPEVLAAGVDTLYTVRPGGDGQDTIATHVQVLRRGTWGGEAVWEVQYRYTGAGISMADTTWFDTATLLPREQRRAGVLQPIRARFDPAGVRLWVGGADGAPADSTYVPADGPVFAGSLMDVLVRALPLRQGLRASFGLFIPERAEVWTYALYVTGTGTVETRDGPVEAWRVEATLQEMATDVFWIARETRVLLRIDHAGGSDATIR